MSRTVFCDLDGVMVDLNSGLARARGRDDLHRGNWPATYDLREVFGVEKTEDGHEEVWGHPSVRGSTRFWADLPKLPWADGLVDLLQSRFEHVVFLSQTVRDPACAAGKLDWAHRNYPGIPILVGTKKTLVSAPGHVLVDDYERNLSEWSARGGWAVRVPAPWNEGRGTPDDRVLEVVRAGLEREGTS